MISDTAWRLKIRNLLQNLPLGQGQLLTMAWNGEERGTAYPYCIPRAAGFSYDGRGLKLNLDLIVILDYANSTNLVGDAASVHADLDDYLISVSRSITAKLEADADCIVHSISEPVVERLDGRDMILIEIRIERP